MSPPSTITSRPDVIRPSALGAVPFEPTMYIDITPSSSHYVANTGCVFHPQDEGGNGNVAFYEIQGASDTIDIDIEEEVNEASDPLLIINTAWGPTDFDLLDRGDNNDEIISEVSGFDTDHWFVALDSATGKLRLTQFDDTQAAVLPYVILADRSA